MLPNCSTSNPRGHECCNLVAFVRTRAEDFGTRGLRSQTPCVQNRYFKRPYDVYTNYTYILANLLLIYRILLIYTLVQPETDVFLIDHL